MEFHVIFTEIYDFWWNYVTFWHNFMTFLKLWKVKKLWKVNEIMIWEAVNYSQMDPLGFSMHADSYNNKIMAILIQV